MPNPWPCTAEFRPISRRCPACSPPLPFIRFRLSGSGIGITFDIEGRPHAPGDSPEVQVSIIEPSYFQTMGITILRGRTFSEDEDQPKGRPVTIVNQAFVRKFFPGEDPIGKRIQPDLEQ